MNALRTGLAATALALATIVAPVAITPASAAAINTQDPAKFISGLTDQGFAALRSGNKAAAKAQFRTLLAQHFAVDQIGERLIRRWSPKITPAQHAAYKAAFPNFIIGTYADRLFEYANASVKVIRTQTAGNGAAVMTQVVKPGAAPINAIWTVEKIGGAYKVTNLTVAGVNLALTQTADFDSYIQRNGFDKLVAFMKSRG
ncbi:MAG TPA: ABC transporter substrate-binding protein [Sphingomonadaceae bacterium]|nr:ABC transporter substrate-binding protein [Sphingomonadaceae bacterium]